jgi:hypothetical protein
MRDGGFMIFCYQRLTRGLGDAIMLRPAIIGSMKQNQQDRHVLHCLSSISCLFRDIQWLEIVEFDSTGTQQFDMKVYEGLLLQSRKLISHYDGLVRVFQLSISESEYEYNNAPYQVVKGQYVPTGKKIEISRQIIWCSVVGVPFSTENYHVLFFDAEHEYADKFLADKSNPLVIHLKSVDKARSYKYPDAFIEYFAKRWDGYVIIMDGEYRGTRKNVVALKDEIRKAWAVISKATALIGIDSFGIHASGSTGVSTYGIFGQTDPKCRLLYPRAVSSGSYEKCSIQPCWYSCCKYVPCLNARKPSWYWEDFRLKIGRF